MSTKSWAIQLRNLLPATVASLWLSQLLFKDDPDKGLPAIAIQLGSLASQLRPVIAEASNESLALSANHVVASVDPGYEVIGAAVRSQLRLKDSPEGVSFRNISPDCARCGPIMASTSCIRKCLLHRHE